MIFIELPIFLSNQVPPYNMMYPQMGRSMGLAKGACHHGKRRQKKLPNSELDKLRVLNGSSEGPFHCSRCSRSDQMVKDQSVKAVEDQVVKEEVNPENQEPPTVGTVRILARPVLKKFPEL